MRSVWKIAVVFIALIIIASLGYFYYLGDSTADATSNTTIVRRIINSQQNFQDEKNQQIDQTILKIKNDTNQLKNNSSLSIITEIVQDLKTF